MHLMDKTQPYPFKELIALFTVSACIKTLLIPAYFSTDFDVHQNWLRITSTRPLEQWYTDEQSKWTFDYPPLFAFFEWMLAQCANLVNPTIASSINRNEITVYFQRITVILSEIPFLLVLFSIIKAVNFKLVAAYFSIPFIILDNIHFQYNIIMQALFLLAVHLIQNGHFLKGAFTYSCLLNFKHIYLYASLAFLAYILKQYVLKENDTAERMKRLIKVGAVTLIPFVISFLPFIVAGGIDQFFIILARLFPFQRGLIHDYWAPNCWALYHFADKLINIVAARLGGTSVSIQVAGDLHQLKYLPQISPLVTTAIILLLSLPIIIKFATRGMRFFKLVFLCGALFFLFGFHVHQKAITPYVGLLLVFLQEGKGRYSYIGSAILVNIVNLLPLLIDSNEKMLRILLPFLWIAIWQYQHGTSDYLQTIIFAAGITVTTYHQLIHPFIKSNKFQFLPLMVNSVFAAAFNLCWITVLYYRAITQKEKINSGDFVAVPEEERD